MISDGDIENALEVRATLDAFIRSGHRVSFLQLGRATWLSGALANDGADVSVIGSSRDLVGLVLGRAGEVWGTV